MDRIKKVFNFRASKTIIAPLRMQLQTMGLANIFCWVFWRNFSVYTIKVFIIKGTWRRRRDSNPRYRSRYTPLAGERLRPLGHVSEEVFSLSQRDSTSGFFRHCRMHYDWSFRRWNWWVNTAMPRIGTMMLTMGMDKGIATKMPAIHICE